MPPKKKRVKYDPDVIKTERDWRRATGKEDDNDFQLSDEEKDNPKRTWTTTTLSRYDRRRSRKPSDQSDEPFPFLKLPAEIRNMIYRYVVVSKAPGPIRLDTDGTFHKGGIETAILATNHQVYDEAAKILYDENVCFAGWSRWSSGVFFRVDDEKTKATTSRSLRSGRAVDMVKHRGLIYEKMLYRLRHVEFHIDIFDRAQMCNHMTLFWGARMQTSLIGLLLLLKNAPWYPKHAKKPEVQDWEIVVHCLGEIGYRTLKEILAPIREGGINWIEYGGLETLVKDSKVRLTLVGKFPKNWEKLFRGIEGRPGYVTEKVEQIEGAADISSLVLKEYFEDFWS